jgi:hypothetical protein
MIEDPKKAGFWTTIPGILTAIAAVLGALSGLIGVLAQVGVFKGMVPKTLDPIHPIPIPVPIPIPENATPKIIAGNYSVHGRNPNGSAYFGEAVIIKNNAGYQITWNIAGSQIFYGTGVLDDQLLKIKWENGLVTYLIRDNGRILDGTWANGKGSEVLTLVTEDQ